MLVKCKRSCGKFCIRCWCPQLLPTVNLDETSSSSDSSEDAEDFADTEIIDRLKYTFDVKMQRINRAYTNWKIIRDKIRIIYIFKNSHRGHKPIE